VISSDAACDDYFVTAYVIYPPIPSEWRGRGERKGWGGGCSGLALHNMHGASLPANLVSSES